MKERPILFSAPMVRAILDGSKTQTRRAVDERWQHFAQCLPMPQSLAIENGSTMDFPGRTAANFVFHNGIPIRDGEWQPVICPHGLPGDRLWVRETYFAYGRWETRFSTKKGRDEWHFIDMTVECDRIYRFAADNPDVPVTTSRHGGATPGWWKRPAIHMPRAVSRTALEITGVRVERLQDISERDAIAEGVKPTSDGAFHIEEDQYRAPDPAECYARLWEAINSAGSWAASLWVWVVEFKRVDGAKGA